MATGPDPNRWTEPDPEAAEDVGPGEHEHPESTAVRWLVVGALVLPVVVFVVAIA